MGHTAQKIIAVILTLLIIVGYVALTRNKDNYTYDQYGNAVNTK